MTITDSDSSNHNKDLSLSVEQDKKHTHAVFFDDSTTSDSFVMAARIAVGLKRLCDRALRANMVIVSTQTLQSAYCTPQGVGHICTTVICQWMDRETLASMQRQQQLMGGK